MAKPEIELVTNDATATSEATPDWEQLYEELGERVYRLVFRMTRDPELAADLTHDTFVRVHERRHQYGGSGSLQGWVFRIAANQVRDRTRRRSTRWRGLRLLRREEIPRAATPGQGALRLALRCALAELPESQRVVLLLHDVDGFTHKEIGVALKIAEGTSKARLSRARATMRTILDTSEAPR